MKASPEQLVALRYVAEHLGALRVEVASTVKYQTELRDRLLALGFRESVDDDFVCRWRLGEWVVDVMPTTPGVLGFSNPWYPHAMATADPIELPPGTSGPLSIRVVSAPAFLATKLVAWEGRGNGDLLHPDIEDIVAVVDGRPGLVGEVEADATALRAFLATAFTTLFQKGLEDVLPGHLGSDAASQARLPRVLAVLNRLMGHAA